MGRKRRKRIRGSIQPLSMHHTDSALQALVNTIVQGSIVALLYCLLGVSYHNFSP